MPQDMPQRLKFKEPASADYIYIDPETNEVHLLVPIIAGGEAGIGTDNTCKSALALQKFFGFKIGEEDQSAYVKLQAYSTALLDDIRMLEENGLASASICESKRKRLASVNNYIKLLEKLKDDKELHRCLYAEYPRYPESLTRLMQKHNNNLFSMKLNPEVQDPALRTVDQVFSLNRTIPDEDPMSIPLGNRFSEKLRNFFKELPEAKGKKLLFTKIFCANKKTSPPYDDVYLKTQLIPALNATIRKLAKDPAIDISTNQHDIEMNMVNLEALMGGKPGSIEEIVGTILDTALDDEFWKKLEVSPFSRAIAIPLDTTQAIKIRKEQLSIITQFFFAQANIHCYANGISTVDFGKILETDVNLQDSLLRMLNAEKSAFSAGDRVASDFNIAKALFEFINSERTKFGITRELTVDDFAAINKLFNLHASTIAGSPHFDEFLLFYPDKAGNAVCHRNLMAVSFADFCLADRYRDIVQTTATRDFLTQQQQKFKGLPTRMLANTNLTVTEDAAKAADPEYILKYYLQPIHDSVNELQNSLEQGLNKYVEKLEQMQPKSGSKSYQQLTTLRETQEKVKALKLAFPNLAESRNISKTLPQLVDYTDKLQTILTNTKNNLDTVGYPGKFRRFLNKILDALSCVCKFSHRIAKKDLEKKLKLTEAPASLTTSFKKLAALDKEHRNAAAPTVDQARRPDGQ